MKTNKKERQVKKLFYPATIAMVGLSIIVASCIGEEHAALSREAERIAEVALHAGDAQGQQIDIILLDERRCLLLGKQVEMAELAEKISLKLGVREGERAESSAVTAVISAGENIKMGQVSDVQSVLRDLGIRQVKYLGPNRISPVMVF